MSKDAKLAIITGGNSGIGKQCALALAKHGFTPLIIARREHELQIIAEQIRRENAVNCYFLACDLTEKESSQRVYDTAVKLGIPLSVLVNNAGGSRKNELLENLNEEDWLEVFNLNLFSVVNLTRKLLPLINTNGVGRIINISSINAKAPGFFNPHYSASKSALNNFTKHLANRLAESKITVNSVSPGIIETEGWLGHIKNKANSENVSVDKMLVSQKQTTAGRIPLGSLGKASDVADLVAFLSSDSSSYITGSDFVIDGGKRTEL